IRYIERISGAQEEELPVVPVLLLEAVTREDPLDLLATALSDQVRIEQIPHRLAEGVVSLDGEDLLRPAVPLVDDAVRVVGEPGNGQSFEKLGKAVARHFRHLVRLSQLALAPLELGVDRLELLAAPDQILVPLLELDLHLEDARRGEQSRLQVG